MTRVVRPYVFLNGAVDISVPGRLWQFVHAGRSAFQVYMPSSHAEQKLIYDPGNARIILPTAVRFAERVPPRGTFHGIRPIRPRLSAITEGHSISKSNTEPTTASFSPRKRGSGGSGGFSEYVPNLADLPLLLRNYPGLTLSWEHVKPIIRTLYKIQGIKLIDWRILGQIWDEFNRMVFVQAVELVDNPEILNSRVFHLNFIERLHSNRLHDFYERMVAHHMRIRKYFRAPEVKVHDGDDVTTMDLHALGTSIDHFISTLDLEHEEDLHDDLMEAVILTDAAVRAHDALPGRPIGPMSLTETVRGLFPDRGSPFIAAVQLIYAACRFRERYGDMDEMLPDIRKSLDGKPCPAVHYLNSMLRNLGITRLTLFTAIGLRKTKIINALTTKDCYCPPADIETILNVLGITNASGIAYLFFKEFIDPHFDVIIRKANVKLSARKPVHPMELIRRYGPGGLARAHRIVNRKTFNDLMADDDFPISAPKSLIYLEHNRGPLSKLGPYLGVIDYYDMGAEGILAIFPFLTQMIPVYQPNGNLVETPQEGDFELSPCEPERYEGMAKRSYAVPAYKKIAPPGSFGYMVAFERALRGWQIADLVDMADLSQSAITLLETGVNLPIQQTIDRLAEAFEMPVSDLYKLAGKKPVRGRRGRKPVARDPSPD